MTLAAPAVEIALEYDRLRSENRRLREEIDIADRGIIIGRAHSADFVLRHESVSRHHARLKRAAQVVWLQDLDSSNGTGCPTSGCGGIPPDGVGDVCDNCPADLNPGQEDADSNGMGDACEPE